MSSTRAAITILRPREEVQRRWAEQQQSFTEAGEATVTFRDAPGDRGTEIQVEVEPAPAGKLGEMAQKLTGSEPLAKAKDDLRRFKHLVETGEIPRSDASPEGELAERKLKQRPARPLDDKEREKVGV